MRSGLDWSSSSTHSTGRPEQPVGLVQLVDVDLAGDLVQQRGRRERPGEGERAADPDGRAGGRGPGRHRERQNEEPGQQATAVEANPRDHCAPSAMRVIDAIVGRTVVSGARFVKSPPAARGLTGLARSRRVPDRRRANDAFWPVHEHGYADLVGSAGALAAPREDRMGHRLRHRPLLPEHQGARGRHARIVEHAERAGRAGAAHARGHDRARQHVSPSGGGREDGGSGRHHLRRPAAAGAGRRLAAERARGLRHSLLHDEGAAGAPGRGVPGDALAVDRAPQQLQGPVLPALGRAARSQAACSHRIRS